MSQNNTPVSDQWAFACHLNYGGHGAAVALHGDGTHAAATPIPAGAPSGQPLFRRPVFIGLTRERAVLLMDPVSGELRTQTAFPPDAQPDYAYVDRANNHYWFVNDGDEETGVNPVSCGGNGSPVSVLDATGRVLKTLCLGRGHHVTAFTAPSPAAPRVPRRVYASNLLDGTLSVIGHDPADPATYLNLLGTFNLCEPDKEQSGQMAVPNNAFPHGMCYSPVTGKVYNLNNGYGTVAVIDPIANAIETTVSMKGCSNLLLSPDGRFVIGKGADRKTNPEHVLGRIAVMDAATRAVGMLELPDFYPSTYRFNPDGRKLYVTSAATGKGTQKANLKLDTVLVFDTSALPRITLIKEIKVGRADCGRRPVAFHPCAGAVRVFIPNPTDGTLSVLDGETDAVLATVTLGAGNIEEASFSFWDTSIYGA